MRRSVTAGCLRCTSAMATEEPESESNQAKRARVGTMPTALRERIERELSELGTVEYNLRRHRRTGPVRPRVLPAEDLVHTKVEEVRKGHGNRVHYRCSNPKCGEIRKDRWESHITAATSDV